MKKLLFITCLVSALTTLAQTDSIAPVKNKTFRITTVHLMDGKTIKGRFYHMDNDHIYLLNAGIKHPNHMNIYSVDGHGESIRIDALQINTITLKRKNGGLRGALIGLGIGVITGAIIGYGSNDDQVVSYTNTFDNYFSELQNAFAITAGQKAAVGALLVGTTGALTGAIIGGLLKKKFIIGGKKDVFRDHHHKLMQR